MSSKVAAALSTSASPWRIGCVVGAASAAYASCFSVASIIAHMSVNSVHATADQPHAHSAKDSLSQRSSHQRMVTMSPNHMCAISCSSTRARTSRSAYDGGSRKMKLSLQVTHP